MLKVWNIDKLSKQMNSRQLSEWIAFMKYEDEEMKKSMLEKEASHEVERMRAKRGRK